MPKVLGGLTPRSTDLARELLSALTPQVHLVSSPRAAEMTKLLEKAFAEAARLSPGEQDAFAAWVLEELESERKWDVAFQNSPDALAKLAAEALAEDDAGRTKPMQTEHQ